MKHILVPVELIERAAIALERFANDTLPGRNAASHLRDALAAAPAVQGERVGYVRRSAIELMTGDGLGVRANIVKEPRYPDCVALYTAPQPAEQQPTSAYACTVPDDCETLHWRGQILSMNELVSVTQPVVDEEIHVNIEGGDVLTLPLASSGMSAPRFVVHVPAQQPAEQQAAPDVARLIICDECHAKCSEPYTGLFASQRPDEEPCLMCECSRLRRQLASRSGGPGETDVKALVEALELARRTLAMAALEGEVTRRIDSALAAHRKGGEV